MIPWPEADNYAFKWETFKNDKAQAFLVSLSTYLASLTPARRVEALDNWIVALRNPQAARKKGIGFGDQHLVITTLIGWREDNRERIAA